MIIIFLNIENYCQKILKKWNTTEYWYAYVYVKKVMIIMLYIKNELSLWLNEDFFIFHPKMKKNIRLPQIKLNVMKLFIIIITFIIIIITGCVYWKIYDNYVVHIFKKKKTKLTI